MKNRTIERLLFAEEVDMGGMPVFQPFPTQLVEDIDPFLLLHHHIAAIPDSVIPLRSGVEPHPHRGFSPVTFVYKGGVHHRDSRGNNSVVYAGGTQWMNAGMGIIHSERPPRDIQERGGVQEIVQLWINTPAKHKLDQPAYIPLQAETTPTIHSDGTDIQVITGEFGGINGPIRTFAPMLVLRISLKANSTIEVPIPDVYNAFFYLLHGQVKVPGYGLIDERNVAIFKHDGEGVTITAMADAQLLLLAGEPLNEPVAKHGPFVMNTQTEIMKAMRDYQQGKMGVLIEE
jgi:quercetin 2,3-dioxygenase